MRFKKSVIAMGAVFTLCLLAGCGKTTQNRAPVIHYGISGGADSAGVHTVSRGDTLWSISQRYKLSMQDLVYLNKLHPPYALDINQRLVLPPPTTYMVRAHDTLYGISRTFDTSMTQIARLNHLSSPYTIQPGQVLNMPSVRPAPAARASVSTPRKPTTSSGPEARVASAAPVAGRKPVRKAPVSSRTPARAGSKFIWPVSGSVISSYGPKKDGLHNDGINIKAPKGTPVRAAENGRIVYAGNELKGFGNLVLVRHEGGWVTAYAHLDKLLVKRGQEISRGSSVGTVGSSGGVSTPQLHFETRKGTRALNPKAYLVPHSA